MRSHTPCNASCQLCSKCGTYNSCLTCYYINGFGPICQDCYNEYNQKNQKRFGPNPVEDLDQRWDDGVEWPLKWSAEFIKKFFTNPDGTENEN